MFGYERLGARASAQAAADHRDRLARSAASRQLALAAGRAVDDNPVRPATERRALLRLHFIHGG